VSKLIPLLLLMFIGISVESQSLYEFEYYYQEKTGREDYKAFFVRNEDGTGFVRVLFFDPDEKQHTVVEMLIQEHYDTDEKGNPDTNALVVETYDPNVLSGNKKNGYSPDYFWFKKSGDGDFFEPWAVVSPDENNQVHEGVISNVRLIETRDLTREFVSQYFAENETFYKNLFDVAVVKGLGNKPTASTANAKLHLVLVANTEDASIGTTCVVDKDATLKSFQQIAEYLNLPFTPQVIFGKYYSKVNVDNAINSLNPGSSDIVVFYYTGHGYSNSNDSYTFPYLDLRTKDYQPIGGEYTLNMQDIYNRIKSKGARLNIVLSDCCNSDPSLSNRSTTGTASLRTSSLGWSLQNCQQLFLNEKRTSILMTAAAKGELSAGNNSNGGFFTFNFRESLEKRMGLFSQLVSWEDLLVAAKKQTITKAANTICPNVSGSGFSDCKQTPVFVIE